MHHCMSKLSDTPTNFNGDTSMYLTEKCLTFKIEIYYHTIHITGGDTLKTCQDTFLTDMSVTF